MTDPDRLDQDALHLATMLQGAMALKDYAAIPRYAVALDEFRAWWEAGAEGDPPDSVHELLGDTFPLEPGSGYAAPLASIEEALSSLHDAVERELALVRDQAADTNTVLHKTTDELREQGATGRRNARASRRSASLTLGLLSVLLVLVALALFGGWQQGEQVATAVASVATNAAALAGAAAADGGGPGSLETTLPAQITSLQGGIGTLGKKVGGLSTRVIVSAEDEMLAARLTMTATVQAIQIAAMEVAATQTKAAETNLVAKATAESLADAQAQLDTKELQLNSLETRVSTGMADLVRQREEVENLAISVAGTATALAATQATLRAPIDASDTPGGGSTMKPTEAPQPTGTPEPVQTLQGPAATVEPTADVSPSTVRFTFPTDGAQLFTTPWQIVVEGDPWLQGAEAYRLMLNGALLAIYGDLTEGEPIVHERIVDGAFDRFLSPIVSGADTLPLDANGQLPPGTYALTVAATVGGDSQLQDRVIFTILDSATAITATYFDAPNALRQAAPDQNAARLPDSLPSRSDVLILGKAIAPHGYGGTTGANPSLVPWCFWQSVANPRRGWSRCELFTLGDGHTVDQVAGRIADLMPAERE